MSSEPLHLFEATGIELEYMLVDNSTLAVLPAADQVLAAAAGQIVSEVEQGPLAWSNELVLHVIELKTNGPAPALEGLAPIFQDHIRRINAILAPLGGRLMPTACHPWMDPLTETVLWPHEYSPVYEAYDRIFGCRGHGWSNLQSMHINLPFAGDLEFARLHAAIRFLLPIMPALTASSPILDGRLTGHLDARMAVYCRNSERIPSVAGRIVPEPVYTQEAYAREIFQRMYADIAPFDPAGTLQHEFLNARGAIARFERGAIEIRVLDVQEHPGADLAVASLIIATLEALCAERWRPLAGIRAIDTAWLAGVFQNVIRDADRAVIADPVYLGALGLTGRHTAGDIWQYLAQTVWPEAARAPELMRPLATLLDRGCLAGRILTALGGDIRPSTLFDIYAELCVCLAQGEMFRG
ncbi:MAG: glutamate--cysteine ligase [Desulfatitalea sp. BRH_c12]|nr:MAG: glutamate--cysteine ligase [Desulfatitalea sp. BRH_c12]